MSVRQSTLRLIATTLVVVLFTLVFVAFGPAVVRNFFAIILLGAISIFYTSMFLVPAFWANVNHKRVLTKPQAVLESEEVEQVEVNNEDSQAEVIEVEDTTK